MKSSKADRIRRAREIGWRAFTDGITYRQAEHLYEQQEIMIEHAAPYIEYAAKSKLREWLRCELE